MTKPMKNQPVVITVGMHKGKSGVISGRSGAGWAIRLADRKTVTVAATSFKRGAA
jgi:hypothetical protein